MVLVTPSSGHGAGEIASSAPAGATSPGGLPELPRLAAITNPEPDPAAVKDVDRLLERLAAEDERSRTDAKIALGEVQATAVPAIRHRIHDLRGALDRGEAARLLDAARKAGRRARHGGEAASPKKTKKEKARPDDDEGDGDWLDFMLAAAQPKDKSWRALTQLLGLERMLTTVGTTPAVRELVGLYASFGELLRIDLQRQVAKLRDKAVPALIEARQHDAKTVQKWAGKELDALGRAIPGEAVASNDPLILADVLRAYGRTRDVDALRVILSYSNSERTQLRDAAREAVAAIGEPGLWQLRDQYLGLTGDKPPHGWAWDRIARELFALYDRGRLTEINTLMDEGLAAAAAGKAHEATVAFDKVLARAPLFERRKEMAKTYFDVAKGLAQSQHEEALAMLRKAWRLDTAGPYGKPIESEIAYLEGMVSVDRHAPDKTAFEQAIAIDATNDRARAQLALLQDTALERQSHLRRYALAFGIGLVALIAMILLARPRRARTPPVEAAPGPESDSTNG
jgi:tetratricopeptide (TPR) repeat protein